MLLHQLLAIIVYSGWHYGRVFHENQQGRIDFQQAAARVALILLMSYFLYAKTLLFFAPFLITGFFGTIVQNVAMLTDHFGVAFLTFMLL